jgi:hypothetical protein
MTQLVIAKKSLPIKKTKTGAIRKITKSRNSAQF